MEDEIDLRPYIKAIFKAWPLILGTAIVIALVAFGTSALLPKKYEAEAVVAIIRERTNVSFGTSIETQEDVLGSRDVIARREALIALVTSNDVAEQVLKEMEDKLVPDDRRVTALLKMVTASNTGDLILIKVVHENPQMAAEIANVWAKIYEDYVNTLYVSGTSTRPDILSAQTQAAEVTYKEAQSDYEAFIGNNPIDLLENEIRAKDALLSSYLTATTMIQSGPIQFQANVRQNLLANYYADLGNIEIWLADAETLREQVKADPGSTGADISNTLALIALRSRIFGGSSETIILQLDLVSDVQDPVQIEDVDAIIEVLEKRREETENKIESLSISFASVEPTELIIDENHPIRKQIVELDTGLLKLREDLVAQAAEQQELAQARDIAWDTFQALAKKEMEVAISAGSTGTEVQLASHSTIPGDPLGTGNLVMAFLGLVFGGMLAVFWVTAQYWWQESEIANGEPVQET